MSIKTRGLIITGRQSMAQLSKVYEFACKWLDKFNNPEVDYIELVDRFFAEDCRKLGFEMDCGIAFNNKYKGAFNHTDLLRKIINEITDISLIGSALYSQWRYYNHWAYDAEEILKPESKEWFIILLKQLKNLTKE